MLKNALFFAIGALVIAFAAPSFFGDPDAHVAARAAVSAPSAQPAQVQSTQMVADAEPASNYREATIAADRGGQYRTKVLIEGQDVDVMVDTGATVVALSAETAARLGVAIDTSQPRWRMTTANGVVFANPVTLKAVSIGAIYMPDVQAVVMPPGASSSNLLGASFLKRLVSVEQRNGMLVLRQ